MIHALVRVWELARLAFPNFENAPMYRIGLSPEAAVAPSALHG
jgi:hypothetical protein